jgi:hypothetical protein
LLPAVCPACWASSRRRITCTHGNTFQTDLIETHNSVLKMRYGFYEHDPWTMVIEWYDHDWSKIGLTCQISNSAHCEMLQMVAWSLGSLYEEPGDYSEQVKIT